MKMRILAVLAGLAVGTGLALSAGTTTAHQSSAEAAVVPCPMMGMMGGPGMMGQGMMGSTGMMGGTGMMGPGMMGPGMMGPGMMGPGMMGPGMMGPGMMGPGVTGVAPMMAPAWPQTLPKDLGVDDVRRLFENRLAWQGNDRLKLGAVTEKDADTIVAEIVTVDGSLVQRFEIDRHTGWIRPVRG